jgi:hypothetical protein
VSQQGSRAFWVLWLGQLVSNLGTQASLYGMGLWLFQQHWRVVDFAAVAVVVQLARLVILPVLGKRLASWPRRRTMLVANGVGGCVTAGLALLLLRSGAQVPVPLLLALLAISAAAEAALVLCFSSLITTLLPEGPAQTRAAGLFASSDGLVLTLAPFLGAWLAAEAGLRGVLLLDGFSFLWAFVCVGLAPWPRRALGARLGELTATAAGTAGFRRQLQMLLRHPNQAPLAWLGMALALVYAGCEVLFPAWLLARMGPDRLGLALLVGGMGYGLGVGLWAWRRPGRPLLWLRVALVIQGWVLIGSGLVVFEQWQPIWWLGVLAFSVGIPINLAALQVLWQQQVSGPDQPAYFAVRLTLESWARLVGFLGLAALVDGLIRPALSWSIWPAWLLQALGTGPGRPMAMALGLAGWLLLITGLRQAAALSRSFSQA